MTLRRSGAVLVAILLFGVACNAVSGGGRGNDPSKADPGTPDVTETPEPAGLEIDLFVPLPDEIYVGAKRAAARVVQRLTTYRSTDAWSRVIKRVPAGLRVSRGVLRSARGLHISGTSSVSEIVYPQLGGLGLTTVPQTASVMVVVRQDLDDGSASVSRTVDVRVTFDGDRWRVASIDSIGGKEIEEPGGLSEMARSVLANQRIELADSARWDIYRGDIDERLLALMSRLAQDYTFSVAVLKSGHPVHVYGSAAISNHTAGRAVDIWNVEGVPVVSQRGDASSPAYRLTESVFQRGEVPEIGSPWDFDAGGSRSFTNDVHLDHIHLGYDG